MIYLISDIHGGESVSGLEKYLSLCCESSPKWKEMGLWYPGEEPTENEISFAYENLKKYNNKVDYILTHKYPQSYESECHDYSFEGLIKYIDRNVSFKNWYSGHWHQNIIIDDMHTVVYDKPLIVK